MHLIAVNESAATAFDCTLHKPAKYKADDNKMNGLHFISKETAFTASYVGFGCPIEFYNGRSFVCVGERRVALRSGYVID